MQYISDWQLVLGVVLLAIVMFWPDGILGSFGKRGSSGLAGPGIWNRFGAAARAQREGSEDDE